MNKKNALQLDRVAFIGRTYFEYLRMFDLDESLLKRGTVLDCASGPSSFTAEAHSRGIAAVAADVLYDLPAKKLEQKGRNDIAHVFQKVDEVPHLYVWKHYRDREEIVGLRHRALETFSRDFSIGSNEGRYVPAELPQLPFPDRSFSLVLSSHFLFLYGDRLGMDFHVASLKEMARVSSGEVRIFPLQGLDAKPYQYLDRVRASLEVEKINVEIVEVPFEFQKGSNKIMRLRRGI